MFMGKLQCGAASLAHSRQADNICLCLCTSELLKTAAFARLSSRYENGWNVMKIIAKKRENSLVNSSLGYEEGKVKEGRVDRNTRLFLHTPSQWSQKMFLSVPRYAGLVSLHHQTSSSWFPS
jgi:hypothetical protein